MNDNVQKLAFTELRIVPYQKGHETEISDIDIAKAVTVNENLMTLGYTLLPNDIARLAASPSINSFYEDVKNCVGSVDAPPMYPDFPSQVMGMDEAMYRLNQIIHYASTYGAKAIFGEDTFNEVIKKGWLPDVASTEKTEKDSTLLKAKGLELVEESKFPEEVLKRILSKKEDMSEPEKQLVQDVVKDVPLEKISELQIPFKRNLLYVFNEVMHLDDKEKAKEILHGICQHTGDVLKCMDYYLTQKNFHLKTSEKRMLVKLLESYPAVDFKSNLILSAKKAQRSTLMLQYLDYNKYSRSPEHKISVAQLRNGELKSWEGQLKYLFGKDKDRAFEFVSRRPGMMLRMTAWMLRMGYDKDAIAEKLCENADKLSLPTLNSVMNAFSDGRNKDVSDIMSAAMYAKMQSMDTPLANKNIFLAMDGYNLEQSSIQKDRADEGGYVRNGIAYSIPEEASSIRFFVYWNDPSCVDLDLHANGYGKDNEEVHVGWNSDFKQNGIVTSGDITHSDAAEYIDINLKDTNLKEVFLTIDLFSGADSFKNIQTCFTGVMAVDKLGQEVALYDPANCFFSHELRTSMTRMNYGKLDIEHNCLTFSGKETNIIPKSMETKPFFSLKEYLDMLLDAQNATLVDGRNQADIVLSMGKEDGCLSLIDSNYFMDSPSVERVIPSREEQQPELAVTPEEVQSEEITQNNLDHYSIDEFDLR